MSLVLQYVQHASVVLNSKLGEHHKYSQVLKSIIDTSDETQAGIIISTICHDPEIHKVGPLRASPVPPYTPVPRTFRRHLQVT